MALREDVQRRLMSFDHEFRSIVGLESIGDTDSAKRLAEKWKQDTITLIHSVIEERRALLAAKIGAQHAKETSPEDLLLETVMVTRAMQSIFTTMMKSPPTGKQKRTILEPMACADALLKAALQHLPEEPSDGLESTTIDFVVE